MALSEKKKSIIIAEWKTGKFNRNALAKKHKISRSTAGIIVQGIEHDTAPLLEKAIEVEELKSNISRTESNIIDREVKKHMERARMSETIIDLGLQTTIKNLAKVNKDVDNKTLSATDRASHQRTIKMGIETARLVMVGPEEEKPEEPDYDVSAEEISAAIAAGLPD